MDYLYKGIKLRLATPDDAEKIVSLVSALHGTLHPNEALYEPASISHDITAGTLNFILAETAEGKHVGMIGAQADYPKGNLVFMLLTVDPEYRGMGLASEMQTLFDKLIDLESYESAYVHCLTLNTFSQQIQARNGYYPCGLLLDRYILDNTAKFLRHDNLPLRRNHLIMAKALRKKDLGKIYLTERSSENVSHIYSELGVSFQAVTGSTPMVKRSIINGSDYKTHAYREIKIDESGEDIVPRIFSIAGKRAPDVSTNVFVSIKSPGAPRAVKALSELGFFYTGIQPFLSHSAYLIMHRPTKDAADFIKVDTIEAFREQREYIVLDAARTGIKLIESEKPD